MAAARAKQADDETEAARNRVVTLTTSVGRSGPPAKLLAKAWIAFVEAAQNGSAQATEDAYYKFTLQLADMQLLGRKLAATQVANKREIESYVHKQQELVESISKAKEVIEKKKQELAEARIWRQQQEEYEVLREQIIKVQPRHETQQQIDAVNKQIDSIRADIRRQEQTYEVIAKKCAAVRYQLEDLLNSFPKSDSAAGPDAAPDAVQAMQIDG